MTADPTGFDRLATGGFVPGTTRVDLAERELVVPAHATAADMVRVGGRVLDHLNMLDPTSSDEHSLFVVIEKTKPRPRGHAVLKLDERQARALLALVSKLEAGAAERNSEHDDKSARGELVAARAVIRHLAELGVTS